MKSSWIALVAALGMAYAMAAHAETKSDSSAAAGFVQQALESGEEEVALARIAAAKATSGDVIQFAQMLISDHGAVNEQLRLLSRRNGRATTPPGNGDKDGSDDARPPATAPGAAPSSGKAAELGRLSGSALETRFLEMVVEGHEKSVELYATEVEKGGDPAIKKLATEMLPNFKAHLRQAKSLQQQATKERE